MKKLSIPSAMVGLTFGLIATVFVYLFVPPPSSASANDCPTNVYAYNCAESCATKEDVHELLAYFSPRKFCASPARIESIVMEHCYN